MYTLLPNGIKINSEDLVVFQKTCDKTADEWLSNAIDGLLNRSKKTILKDYLNLYREGHSAIPADYSLLFPLLIGMPEFKPYNYKYPENETPNRKYSCDITVLDGGKIIQDWEKQILDNYYSDLDVTLIEMFENKIEKRRKEFIRIYLPKLIDDPSVTDIPSDDDDLIQLIIAVINP
ncbi:MAG: hypothetical protein ACE5GV_00225 [Candidatus Scalindua sp.]